MVKSLFFFFLHQVCIQVQKGLFEEHASCKILSFFHLAIDLLITQHPKSTENL